MPDLNNRIPPAPPLPERKIPRIEVDHQGEAGQVNLSRLPKDQRGPMWERIKQERPAQAELIRSDTFQALREAFDGEVCIEEFPTDD